MPNNVEVTFEGTYQQAIDFLLRLQGADTGVIPRNNVRLYVDMPASVLFPLSETEKEKARSREIL